MRILIKYNNYFFKKRLKDILIIDADYKAVFENDSVAVRKIYCSSQENNLFIFKKMALGHEAIYIRDNLLMIFDGQDNLPILKFKQNINENLIKKSIYIAAIAYGYQISFLKIRFILKDILD